MSTDVATIELTAEEAYELETCAMEINKASKTLSYSLLSIGQWAAKAHAILAPRRDGAFARWIETECQCGKSWAYLSLKVWKHFGSFQRVENINVLALLELSADSVPQQARDISIERAESGEQITGPIAKRIIADAKAQPGPVDTVDEAPPKPRSQPVDAGDCGEARSEPAAADSEGDEPDEEFEYDDTEDSQAVANPQEPNTLGEMFAKADAYLDSLVASRPLYASQALADHLESESLPRLRRATA